MRILAVTNLFPTPYEPNRAAFNRHQLVALGRLHEVRVIAPISWTDELSARLRRGGRTAPQPVLPRDRRLVCDGLSVDHPRYYHTPKLFRGYYGHFYRASVARRFRRAVDEFRPDLVLGTWAYPDGWAAVRLARAARVPVVVKVHGCDVLCGGRGLQSDPPRLRRTIEALRGADGVVAVSEHLARHVAALGVDARRIRTVYNGVDRSVFHPGPHRAAREQLGVDPDGRIVLFVGRLDPVKGLDVLLDALARPELRPAAGATPAFKCVVVGDGPLRAQLEQRAAELRLGDAVCFVGGRPQRQLGAWYRAADLTVVPSYSEGVPGVLMEAAACGTPFVASRVGGIPEIAHLVPSTLVPPGDAAALAAAIREHLSGAHGPRPASDSVRSHADSAADLAIFLEEVVAGRAAAAAATSPGHGAARTMRPATQSPQLVTPAAGVHERR